MKLPNVSGVVKVVKTFALANRPEILLGAAVTATVGAVVLAAQGGYKARGIVDEAEIVKGEPLDVKEKIQLTWLCYIPATIAATTALGSTFGLHLVHVKDKKALATAGMAAIEEAKTAAEQYRKELLEVTDEEKVKEVDAKVEEKTVAKRLDKVQDTDGEIKDMYLVRDPITHRDVWATKAQIEEAAVELGNCINESGEASLNNFYEEAGWGHIPIGEEYGWSGVIPTISWVDEMRQPITGVRDDGRPFRGFRFLPAPEKGYDDIHG